MTVNPAQIYAGIFDKTFSICSQRGDSELEKPNKTTTSVKTSTGRTIHLFPFPSLVQEGWFTFPRPLHNFRISAILWHKTVSLCTVADLCSWHHFFVRGWTYLPPDLQLLMELLWWVSPWSCWGVWDQRGTTWCQGCRARAWMDDSELFKEGTGSESELWPAVMLGKEC